MGRFHTAVCTTLLLTAFLLPPDPANGQAAAEESDQPISIEANRMVSQENKNSVVFIGKVDARQGTLTIKSDEMTVFYTEKKGETPQGQQQSGQPTNQVEKLICTGNVKISQGDWLGAGERMDYFAKERKAVLSGNARAWQGQNMVSGKSIVYYLDEKRSVVEPDTGGNNRVRAIIHPESKKKP
ncbi:MAG: lipopolysaccharide transport periplasmic protein LptA [Desulfobulbus sp.]|jgi:lipopolysaccharide export system protein LptA|uniref:lipopolysaccharide transport periplasmic protein LptA n=1 Tax=Desulfobulbus sp. TaxID=895 RepID=UPI00283C17E9|nr:lipopolysaccharide transport periplasmic protein LptA [Desulfobulbus sp.]MDR2548627.1 lipopolysaccharide transport periplasmic protein LptA [Desulfobulbus sp.]